MRYFFIIFFAFLALYVYPRKTLTCHSIPKSITDSTESRYYSNHRKGGIKTKHSIPKQQKDTYIDDALYFKSADSVQSVKKENYTLLINYSDGHQFEWGILGPSRAVQFDADPRLMPVYFNPASPKFFHAYPDCKKIGAFRKLSETPIEDFLRSNKTANLCPDCMQRNKAFFFISQFILDD